jgi:hypothetical protein
MLIVGLRCANPTYSLLRGLLDQHAETIVAKLIEHAIAGESAALKICIERLIPRVKPDSGICFALPKNQGQE